MNEQHVAQATVQGMAECMDMVRAELVEAGIVDQSVPPMMLANAVLAYIGRERRIAAAERNAVIEEVAEVFVAPVAAELLNSDVVDIIRALKGKPAALDDEKLPKWIDDQKGKDPSTDDLIEEIIRLRGLCRQIAAVEGEEVRQLRATVDKRQHDVLREALACIEYYESKQLADSVRAILDQHGKQIGAYRAPLQIPLEGIHVARLYFDWSRPDLGFGQLSIGKQEDGRVTCMNECMGREFVRGALHAAIDVLVDAAELQEV